MLTLIYIRLYISSLRPSLSTEPKNNIEILKKPKRLDRGKGELENAKGHEHGSIFTFKMASLKCFQTDLLPQAEQSIILLIKQGVLPSILVLDIIRTVSRLRSRVKLQVHFKFALGILFLLT